MLDRLLDFIKRHTKSTLTLIFILALVVGMYSTVSKDEQKRLKESKVPPTNITVEGITPGLSGTDDLKRFGKSRSIEQNSDGSILHEFGPERSPEPTKVVVRDSKIVYVQKHVSSEDPGNISYFLNNFGEPDFILFYKVFGFKTYVFLDEGMAVVAFDTENIIGAVYELRYFVPTTKEEFLRTWGSDLPSEEPIPGY